MPAIASAFLFLAQLCSVQCAQFVNIPLPLSHRRTVNEMEEERERNKILKRRRKSLLHTKYCVRHTRKEKKKKTRKKNCYSVLVGRECDAYWRRKRNEENVIGDDQWRQTIDLPNKNQFHRGIFSLRFSHFFRLFCLVVACLIFRMKCFSGWGKNKYFFFALRVHQLCNDIERK